MADVGAPISAPSVGATSCCVAALGQASLADERLAVKQQRQPRVVVPRRAVHERVERIALGDDRPFARHEEQLAAAAGEVAAREALEPGLSRCARPVGVWASGRGARISNQYEQQRQP